jgi:hypothetical protein
MGATFRNRSRIRANHGFMVKAVSDAEIDGGDLAFSIQQPLQSMKGQDRSGILEAVPRVVDTDDAEAMGFNFVLVAQALVNSRREGPPNHRDILIRG